MRDLRKNLKLLALTFIAWVGLALLITPGVGPCGVRAQDLSSDYCAVGTLTITNGTGSTITNKLVGFLYPASGAISALQLDPRAWDLRSVSSGFTDVEVIAQDLSSNVARWWLLVDSLEAGSSIAYQLYSGCPACLRNQGVPFISAASSSATVLDAADLKFLDDFAIEVDVENDGVAPSTSPAWWVSKWTGGVGYRFGVFDDGGVQTVRAQLDATTIDAIIGWDGLNHRFRLEVSGGDVQIWQDGVEISPALATGTATTNAANLTIGASFDGTIRHIAVSNWDGEADDHVSAWGFNPSDMAEVSYVVIGPQTGTIEDTYGTNNASYSWVHDQTDITFSLSPISSTSSSDPVTFDPAIVDLLGPQFATDLTSRGTIPSFMPFSTTFNYWQTDAGFPGDFALALLPTMIAFLVLMLLAGTLPQNGMVIGAAGFSVVLVVGATLNFYQPWYPALWIAFEVAALGAIKAWRFG